MNKRMQLNVSITCVWRRQTHAGADIQVCIVVRNDENCDKNSKVYKNIERCFSEVEQGIKRSKISSETKKW